MLSHMRRKILLLHEFEYARVLLMFYVLPLINKHFILCLRSLRCRKTGFRHGFSTLTFPSDKTRHFYLRHPKATFERCHKYRPFFATITIAGKIFCLPDTEKFTIYNYELAGRATRLFSDGKI